MGRCGFRDRQRLLYNGGVAEFSSLRGEILGSSYMELGDLHNLSLVVFILFLILLLPQSSDS